MTPACAASCSSASPTSSSTSSRTPIPSRPRSFFCSPPTIPASTDWRAVRPVPGKLFLVGDPKQSIYRFRRADVALYEEVKERLLGVGAELLHLTTSFRAPPSIQSFVNGAFAPAMAAGPDASQAAYVPLQPSRPEIGGPADDRRSAGSPALWRLRQDRQLADRRVVSRTLSAPSSTGWSTRAAGRSKRKARTVPIRPRHIAILFRRFRNFGTDVTRPYVRALEARRIPHVLVGGRSFHDREEVIALRNALTAIEWPDDELKVFATLRGPFFALGDEALLAFRQYVDGDGTLKTRRLHPMHAVDRAALDPAAHRGRRRSRAPAAASRRAQPPPDRRDHHHAAGSRAGPCRHRALADRRAGARQLPEADRHGAAFRSEAHPPSAPSSRSSRRMPSAARPTRLRSSRRAPRVCG